MSTELANPIDWSSQELKRRLVIFLSQRGISSPQRISIDVNYGTVTLRGTVSSFYERQLCLCCQHVAGVHHLVDDLKVELPTTGAPRATPST